MTIAPERPDTITDAELDDWNTSFEMPTNDGIVTVPGRRCGKQASTEGFVEDVMRQAALTGAVTFEASLGPLTAQPIQAEDVVEGGDEMSFRIERQGTWTHTVRPGEGRARVLSVQQEDDGTVVAYCQLDPSPQHSYITADDIYDSVRRLQQEEQTLPADDMLRWICECTPSRSQLFGDRRVAQAVREFGMAMEGMFQQIAHDWRNPYQDELDAAFPDHRPVEERCEEAVAHLQTSALAQIPHVYAPGPATAAMAQEIRNRLAEDVFVARSWIPGDV